MIKVRVLIQRGETGLRSIGAVFETHKEKANGWVDNGWVEYVGKETKKESPVDEIQEFINNMNEENNVD